MPAGYIVNTGGATGVQYVSTGAGNKGSTSMPTCSPGGCTTAPDNTIPGWYNAGQYAQPGSALNAIWPGPEGLDTEEQGYSDNGYLAAWSPSSTDGIGYIASMVTFLKSLGASFPFDISAHNGPPALNGGASNVAYADSEAIMASANGVGFGMESVSIYDPQKFAGGVYPTSASDWAYNFKAHPAPVHHLQMFEPGQTYFAAGYAITSPPTGPGITITLGSPLNTATISCVQDCSWFSGITGAHIYVSGNSNPTLNGIWPISCLPLGSQCSPYTLQFSTSVSGGPYPGGTVWASDYWPIVMPFAVQHGASTIEVYECDLDFAFEVQTTGNCASGGVSGPPGTVGYQNSASDTLIGQPRATSVRTGNSILNNGTQF